MFGTPLFGTEFAATSEFIGGLGTYLPYIPLAGGGHHRHHKKKRRSKKKKRSKRRTKYCKCNPCKCTKRKPNRSKRKKKRSKRRKH